MLRRAVEVAAITGSVSAAAALAAFLELGASRSIPAIAGATLTTAILFFRRNRSALQALLAALFSGAAAFALDWFVLFVLSAGYPELRDVRDGPIYQALLVAIFGVIAAFDSVTASAGSPARS
jgi:hypothetical protein